MENPSLLKHFENLPDPRMDRCRRHELIDIIAITICAVLGGCDTWTDIEEFAEIREDWFRKFLKLPNGIPSHDTLSRVFSLLSSEHFQEAFSNWVKDIKRVFKNEIVAIDGKCLRASHDSANGKAAIYMVSAWAESNRLVLGQVKTDEKSNEITAIPELLRTLEVSGCIVTIDAAGCQKKIAQQIRSQGADYVLALKGNHSTLHEDVAEFFKMVGTKDFKEYQHDQFEEVSGGHGRVETRKYWIVWDLEWLENRDQWADLKMIGMVESERWKDGHTSKERRFFVSSLPPNVRAFAKAVRGHWGIENKLHWCLDVSFEEDKSRVRKGRSAQNLAVVRHIATNLLKQETSKKKRSIRTKRKLCSWSGDYLLKILNYG